MQQKILVIDDERTIRELLKGVLQKAQYEVVTAMDGNDGLRAVQSDDPDLILLDIKMPKCDGWSFLKEYQRLDEMRKVPVIVFSSYEKMKELFDQEGVADYVVKPVKAEELLEKVKKHLPSQ